MSPNRIVIVVLIPLFVLLGGYAYFYEINRGERRTKKTSRIEIFNFSTNDVQEIELRQRDQTLLFKKEKGQWSIKRPIQTFVDNNKIDDLLSVFDYGVIRVIDVDPSENGQYGLERPEIEFGIKVKGDSEFRTLLIGSNHPTNVSCYARVKGEFRVLLVGIVYKRELERVLSFFESRRSKGKPR